MPKNLRLLEGVNWLAPGSTPEQGRSSEPPRSSATASVGVDAPKRPSRFKKGKTCPRGKGHRQRRNLSRFPLRAVYVTWFAMSKVPRWLGGTSETWAQWRENSREFTEAVSRNSYTAQLACGVRKHQRETGVSRRSWGECATWELTLREQKMFARTSISRRGRSSRRRRCRRTMDKFVHIESFWGPGLDLKTRRQSRTRDRRLRRRYGVNHIPMSENDKSQIQ